MADIVLTYMLFFMLVSLIITPRYYNCGSADMYFFVDLQIYFCGFENICDGFANKFCGFVKWIDGGFLR